VHAYGHDVADRWLLEDDTEANEVTESGISQCFKHDDSTIKIVLALFIIYLISSTQ